MTKVGICTRGTTKSRQCHTACSRGLGVTPHVEPDMATTVVGLCFNLKDFRWLNIGIDAVCLSIYLSIYLLTSPILRLKLLRRGSTQAPMVGLV